MVAVVLDLREVFHMAINDGYRLEEANADVDFYFLFSVSKDATFLLGELQWFHVQIWSGKSGL